MLELKLLNLTCRVRRATAHTRTCRFCESSKKFSEVVLEDSKKLNPHESRTANMQMLHAALCVSHAEVLRGKNTAGGKTAAEHNLFNIACSVKGIR
jgi:hypothetical protein